VARGPRVIGLTRLAADPHAPVVATVAPGAVVMWNPASGEVRRLALPTAPGSEASAIAFSPDGGRIAVSMAFAQPPGAPPVMVLDARSGRVLGRVAPAFIEGGRPAIEGLALAFSPDGRTLVVGEYTGGSRIVLRDAMAPDLRVERHLFSLTLPVDVVAFSPDGTRIAYGNSDGSGGLMTAGGQPVVRYPGVTSAVNAIAFSPDGRLVLETAQSGDVLVWRAGDLTLGSVKIPGVTGSVQAAPAPSGFVTASIVPAGLVARLWNAGGTPAAPQLVISPTQNVGFFAFSSTQNAGYSRRTGFVAVNAQPTSPTEKLPLRLWDVAARRVVQTLPPGPLPVDASILPGGSTIAQWTPSNAAETSFTFGLLDTHTGREQTLDHTSSGCVPKGASADIAADAEVTRVAYATPCVTRVWDRRTGRWAGPPIRAPEAAAVALTPDGRQIAVAIGGDSVAVYEVATGRQVARLTDPTGTVLEVAFSPNGRYLAVAGQESAIRIYDAHRSDDLRVITAPTPINGTVFFTPDSRNVIGWSQVDSAVREYDACTDCENPSALVALAKTRVTRALTAQERREFGVG
jgi:WD40 repeat protein